MKLAPPIPYRHHFARNSIFLKPLIGLNKKVRLFRFLQKLPAETQHVLINQLSEADLIYKSKIY
jgi:hypothetical protein